MQSLYDLYEMFKVSSGVCIDSRALKEQCVFFCIKGDKYDGHEFAEDVGAKVVFSNYQTAWNDFNN